jgi:hypothetical protein
MESYPSISSVPLIGVFVFAFDKLDGSQIRAEWSKKRGFYKLGSRKQLIADNNFLVFAKERWDRALAFFELHGPNSFAGSHDPNDTLDLTLFDVAHPKKGLMPPKAFVKAMKDLDTPRVVDRGMVTDDFITDIRTGPLREGVVCKWAKGMFKIKTDDWISRVKERYRKDPAKLRELL